MRPGQICARLKVEPFRPLRLHISNGWFREIRHAEIACVTTTQLYIALGMCEDHISDRVTRCDPVRVTRIEPLDVTNRDR